MGPELDLKPKLEASAKASSIDKENPSINLEIQNNHLPCVTNFRDRSIEMEPSPFKPTAEPDTTEKEDINVTDATRSCNVGVIENDWADEVETSSSFDDTVSLTDNGDVLDEVQSQLRGDHTSVSEYEGCYDIFRMRNKKLSAHWRRYIRPLMWRCKWMELQMKKLQSQALMYDRELAQYDETKKFGYERSESEQFDAKSHPFSGQFPRNKAMKRKKRKRVEETTDISSYMSQHNVFSYYEKSSLPDGVSVEVDLGNLGNTTYHDGKFETCEGLSLEVQDADSSLVTHFQNVETVLSRVRNLILRVDKVVAENSLKISSMIKSSIPSDTLGSSAAPEENGNALQVESHSIGSEDTPKQNVTDLLMIDGMLSRHREVTPRSDRIRSADQVRDFANTEDKVLIDNEQAKEELHDFEKFRDQFGEKPMVSEEQTEHPPPHALEGADLLVPSKANVRTRGRKRKRKTRSRR